MTEKLWMCAAVLGAGLAAAGGPSPAQALEECRLLRQPDIQGNVIVFAYAGDLWRVPRSGGTAARVTSHEGLERFPKISPDGKTVAFTGEYDGNVDAYTVPIEGGEPTRLTWHPGVDQVAEWYPDGRSLLLRSARGSYPAERYYKIPVKGGFEQPLPFMEAGYCSFSPDGKELAFVRPTYDNRTWKRYQGGEAPDIWIFDFTKNTSERITDWAGSDEWPMWHERTVYYCSDQGGRTANIWAYDVDKKTRRQVTTYADYDVKWPGAGSDAIVFEKGGYLFVMDLPSEKVTQIHVLVPDDKPDARAEYRNVASGIRGWDLSPSAKRVVVEARGEIFTVPAEKGDPRNLTQSPGSRERAPDWSPDGKWIACFSDKSGEYEIHVYGSDGKTPDRQVTHGLKTYPFSLRWSPDSKKIAFTDRAYNLSWCDVATGKITAADHAPAEEIREYSWAPDSKWLVYSKPMTNDMSQMWLCSLADGQITALSDGMTDDRSPCFDPEGKYIYFISSRTINPTVSQFELNYQYHNTDRIYALTLRDTLLSPTPPQDDEETGADAAKGDDKAKSAPATAKGAGAAGAAPSTPAGPAPVQIQLAGIVQRQTALPVRAGSYDQLRAFKGKLLYLEVFEPDFEGDGSAKAAVHVFDLAKQEDKIVISGVDPGYAASKDGGKILYRAARSFGIVDAAEGKKPGDGKVDAASLMAMVDPRLEWRQMYDETWRLERDFYYDPQMGGLDWKAVGEHYRELIPYVAHRSDLNYIIGELIGELATSHAYVGGGEMPQIPRVGVGLLGADYSLDAVSGLYRFQKIYRRRDWNSTTRAPLGEPGIGVEAGDYLLAVNGLGVKSPTNVFAAFVGTADQVTRITVGRTPSDPRPRTYTVKPVASENSLRYSEWVAENRETVSRATGGRVGYIHVPNTSTQGIQEFIKQYYPQVDKQGLIVDERYNGGGFNPEFFIDRLKRSTWIYRSRRDGTGVRQPSAAVDGPKCMLINEHAGSGGDSFPYYFHMFGIGPLIGTRTWGGLVGLAHSIPLMDGGFITMPEIGAWGRDGKWIVENHGVDPDMEVVNRPQDEAAGRDPQLESAIQYCKEQLEKNPLPPLQRPPYKTQTGLQ